jgi:Uma2 family endonuclease
LRLDDRSELQPDLALLKPRPDFYAQAHPGPADVILIIEVVDTTGRYDREVKLPLYARSAIAEVWIVDLLLDQIEVHTRPAPRGYLDVQRVTRDERLHSSAIPELSTEDVLGPP